MNDPVIRVQGISKAYRIWHSPGARLRSIGLHVLKNLVPPLRARCADLQTRLARDFYALRGVSFEVQRGESIGIVGRNGSGKSTLLQIIAGTLAPTTGTVEVNGRVAALLELGSGFNPEYTGRENVYLNAAILGLKEEETRTRFDAIAAFAEIGEFIDRPVKTYSSGMVVRLAFAVAAHVDADILIIDEALAVGDARFQLKCARAIDRFVARGTTLFFVSHDLAAVKRLCKRAMLLEGGRNLYSGHPNDVANLYTKLVAEGGSAEALAGDIVALQERSAVDGRSVGPANPDVPMQLTEHSPPPSTEDVAALKARLKALECVLAARSDEPALSDRIKALLADERSRVQVSGDEFAYGGERGAILDVAILDTGGVRRTWFNTGEPVVVRMTVESRDELLEPIYALTIKDVNGMEIYGTNTLFSHQPAAPMRPGERREVTFAFDLNLIAGHYFLSFGFTHFVANAVAVIHRRYDAIKIDVNGRDRSFGVVDLKAIITAHPKSERPANAHPS